jgi:hypothetical protein
MRSGMKLPPINRVLYTSIEVVWGNSFVEDFVIKDQSRGISDFLPSDRLYGADGNIIKAVRSIQWS